MQIGVHDQRVIPVLETERLVLRGLVAADAPALYAFRSDPVTQKHNSVPLTDPARAEELITVLDAEHHTTGSLHWGLTIRGDNTVMGLLGYHHWNPEARRAGMGYDLARPLWGRGYMSEAVTAVLDHGFGAMDLNKVEVHTNAENRESVRMVQRLGFRQEGTFHEHFFEDGAFHDVSLYAMLRRDRVTWA